MKTRGVLQTQVGFEKADYVIKTLMDLLKPQWFFENLYKTSLKQPIGFQKRNESIFENLFQSQWIFETPMGSHKPIWFS